MKTSPMEPATAASTGDGARCTSCGHSAQGFRSWLTRSVRCASFTRDSIGDAVECYCKQPLHSTDIVKYSERPDLGPHPW